MKQKTIFTILLFIIFYKFYSQTLCTPSIGVSFITFDIGTNFRESANINSKIIYSIQNPEKEFFYCVEDGFTNNFVKLKIKFDSNYLEKNGLKKNFIKLYEHFKDSLKIEITLKDFISSVKNENSIKNYYNTIINQKDTITINYWSKLEDEENVQLYDISTIETFKKNYLNLNLTINSQKLIDNYDKIGYVHKTELIKYNTPYLFFYYYISSKMDLKEINKSIALKNLNSCNFEEKILFADFSRYLLSLIIEKKPFFALQEISKYSTEFAHPKFKFVMSFLKILCSYEDQNYLSTIIEANKLIDSFHKKFINNYTEEFSYSIINRQINFSVVYKIIIASLINTDQNILAYKYSKECIVNKKLQYNDYLINHAIILYNIGKKIEACKIINQEYLKGNETAKKIQLDYCR